MISTLREMLVLALIRERKLHMFDVPILQGGRLQSANSAADISRIERALAAQISVHGSSIFRLMSESLRCLNKAVKNTLQR